MTDERVEVPLSGAVFPPELLEALVRGVAAAFAPPQPAPPAADAADFLTAGQFADRLGVSRETVRRLAIADVLPCTVVCRGSRKTTRRYPRRFADDFAASGAAGDVTDLGASSRPGGGAPQWAAAGGRSRAVPVRSEAGMGRAAEAARRVHAAPVAAVRARGPLHRHHPGASAGTAADRPRAGPRCPPDPGSGRTRRVLGPGPVPARRPDPGTPAEAAWCGPTLRGLQKPSTAIRPGNWPLRTR